MVIGQKRRHIQKIAKPAEREGHAEADAVGDGTGKKAHYGKGAIQSRVGVIHIRLVELAGTSQTTDGIEHSRAEEANEGDQDQLGLGGSEPRECPGAEFDWLVHPGLSGDRVVLSTRLDIGRVLRDFNSLFRSWIIIADRVRHGVEASKRGEG